MSQHSHHRDEPLRNLWVLRDKVDDFSGQMYSRYPTRFACRAGCDGCCQTERVVSDMEFDALALAVAALDAETRARLAAAATPDGPCPLLLDGRCSVYAQRPVVCRSHGMPILMEGRRDVCPLNFTPDDDGAGDLDLDALPAERLLSVDTLTAILVTVNALYCQETGGDADRRRPVSELLER